MTDDSPEQRVTNIERRLDVHEERITRVERDMVDTRGDIRRLEAKIESGFAEMRTSLQGLGLNMLDALPKWASEALERKNAVIGIVASLAAVAVTAALAVMIHRPG